MKRILVSDGMDKSAFDNLNKLGFEAVDKHYTPEELPNALNDYDAVIVRSATKLNKDVLRSAIKAGRLKLIVRAGVGLDSIDVDFAKKNGIAVYNTPKASSRAVAELAIAHMFAIARFLHISNVSMRKGEWNKKQYKGVELFGKTLGIIGFGRIGVYTAKLASSLGMNIIYHQRRGAKEGYEGFEYASKKELLQRSDFITLHLPYVKESGAVLKKEDFDLMKEGVYIINTSRGKLIDEQALLDALGSGKVAAAGLDVFDNEPNVKEKILLHDRISLSPHIAGYSKEAQNRIGQETVEIISQFFSEHKESALKKKVG